MMDYKTSPDKKYRYCIIAPTAKYHGIAYNCERRWWPTRQDAQAQAKEIIDRNPESILVVVEVKQQIAAARPPIKITTI